VRQLVAVFHALLVAGYPLAVYVGLTRYSARNVGLLLIGLLIPGLLIRLRGARKEDLLAVARVPLAVIAVAGLGALFDDKRFVLAMPVLINAALLATFGSSLWGTPMVERFARLQDPNLGPAQVAYCRTVTKVWCGFFVFNIGMSGWLALFAPLSWWALYTGIIAYVLIGVLATAEYIVRKERFREYGNGLHDRILMRLFPPRAPGVGVPQ
jgi:uncharacterized membrane protein